MLTINIHAGVNSPFLAHTIDAETAIRKSKPGKKLPLSFNHSTVSAVMRISNATLPRLTSLISTPEIFFSDSLVIQSVYLAIGPLLVNEPAVKRAKGRDANSAAGEPALSALRSLRLEAMGCLRGVRLNDLYLTCWLINEPDICKV